MLNRLLKVLLIGCLAAGTVWAADNPFVGRWKLDPSKTRLPDEMKVQDDGANKYTFDFGAGPETIVADGSDQPGTDGTLLSATIEAPDAWIIQRKKDGRLQVEGRWKLSEDGKTLTDSFRQFQPDGSTLSLEYVYQRIGEGSGFAADWQSIKETMNSPFGIELKAFEGDGLTLITPSQHTGTNLRLDDKDYPSGSDASAGSVSSRRMDDHTVVITAKKDGKVTVTEQMTLSDDLKTLTLTVRVPGRDKPNVMVFERQ